MAVLVIVAVGETVAREQHARAGVEAPPRGAQVADHRLDRHQRPPAERDLVALLHPAHAVFVLRERQVVVADVAAQQHVGKGFQDAAQPAAMRRLLVGDEQIFERRHALREQLGHVAFDDREILGMAGLDQDRRLIAGDQERGVVAVIDLALVALRQAVADPEHAGRDLARHFVGHGLILCVARMSEATCGNDRAAQAPIRLFHFAQVNWQDPERCSRVLSHAFGPRCAPRQQRDHCTIAAPFPGCRMR